MGRSRRKHGRLTRRNRQLALERDQNQENVPPRCFVFTKGDVDKNLKSLMMDFRKVMEPNTATKLEVKKSNCIKDFVDIASHFHVTHLVIFSQTSLAPYMKVARLPNGPTLTFSIQKYSLRSDVLSSLKRPFHPSGRNCPGPCLMTNLLPRSGPLSLQLTARMFLDAFPTITPNQVKIDHLQRCCLINYTDDNQEETDIKQEDVKPDIVKEEDVGKDVETLEDAHGCMEEGEIEELEVVEKPQEDRVQQKKPAQKDEEPKEDDEEEEEDDGDEKEEEEDDEDKEEKLLYDGDFDLRHYAIRVVPAGVSRALKKVIRRKMPDLSGYSDIAEFVTKSGVMSESEGEEDTSTQVTVPSKRVRRGKPKTTFKSAIKLVELGPRLTLKLHKVEDGLLSGTTLYHRFIKKSAKEKMELEKKRISQKNLKKMRKEQQQRNVEAKKKKEAEHKQRCLTGMSKAALEAAKDMDFDDVLGDGNDKPGKGNKRKQTEGLATNKKFKKTQAAGHGVNKQDTTGDGEGKKMTRKERKEMKIQQAKDRKMGVKNPSKDRPQKQVPKKSKQKAWGESKIKKNSGRGRKKF